MTDKISAKDIRNIEPDTIYVGEGASVRGDVLAPKMLVVDGRIEGSVICHAIWVGPSGEIKGNIVVDEAEVYGKISEKIEIKNLLFVHAAGQVIGEICYGELQLENGIPRATREELVRRGHHVTDGRGGFGGYQAILRDDANGVYWAASESRKDGCAIGY